MLLISIFLVSVQSVLIGFATTQATDLLTVKDKLVERNAGYYEAVLTKLMLPQVTRQLFQIREEWVAFTDVYSYKIIGEDGIDEQNLKFFMDVAVRSTQAFGATGDPYVYDLNTGNYYMNPLKGSASNIRDAYRDPLCSNPTGVQEAVPDMLSHEDTLYNNYIVGLRSAGDLSYNDAYNLKEFPLGKYNREFTQRILLPLPNVGERQIVVAISIQEQDVVAFTNNLIAQNDNLLIGVESSAGKLSIVSLICLFFSLVLVIVTNIILVRAVNVYSCSSSR
jgi:hypothetical protein